LPWQKQHSTRKRLSSSAKEEISEVLHLEHSFVWSRNLDSSGTRLEVPGKFWNVVLEKDGEDKLDGTRKQWSSITQSKKENEHSSHYNEGRPTGMGTYCVWTAF
jgi:hypothetical protein